MPLSGLSAFAASLMLLSLAGCQSGGGDISHVSRDERQKLAEINTQLAIEYMRDGDNALALKKLEKAIEADPDSVSARNGLALLYTQIGEAAQAEKNYKAALSLDARNITALNNYGRFLCQQKRYAEGQARFQEAVNNSLNPAPETALTNAGICALDAGEPAKAEEFFRAALQRAPRLVPALFSMARITRENGDLLQARAYFQRYLEVGPASPAALWLGIQIENGLGNRDGVSSYGLQLKNNFPDAPETGQFLRGEFD
jgi:type IV pilus assembly protein PilF